MSVYVLAEWMCRCRNGKNHTHKHTQRRRATSLWIESCGRREMYKRAQKFYIIVFNASLCSVFYSKTFFYALLSWQYIFPFAHRVIQNRSADHALKIEFERNDDFPSSLPTRNLLRCNWTVTRFPAERQWFQLDKCCLIDRKERGREIVTYIDSSISF